MFQKNIRRRKAADLRRKARKKVSRAIVRVSPHFGKILTATMTCIMLLAFTSPALAATDIWTAGNNIIKDIYSHLVQFSTILAALMTAIAVIGVKISNNQNKSDHAWDWLKRIWIAWAIINSIGAIIAYIVPLFDGLGTLDIPSGGSSDTTP